VRHGLTYLFVSHDLAAVRELATRVAVMYLGRVVELAAADTFFDRPLHPYSAALLSAIPRADVPPSAHRRIVLNGEPPSPLDVPPGCPFHPRCPAATDHCRAVVPPLAPESGALAACHYPGVLDAVRSDAAASATAS
jgi:oligopeptide/dipeptide ABC transporter ATP-binding protein